MIKNTVFLTLVIITIVLFAIKIKDSFKIAKLYRLVYTDSLTGLYNRRYCTEKILKKKKDFLYILALDIDHFKNVNDTYGHVYGDYVLKETGKILKNNTRSNDCVIRSGGEEFFIFLQNSNKELAIVIAERIRQTIENYDFLDNNIHAKVTISIGIAKHNKKYSYTELYREADSALYDSKESGRNKVTMYNNGICYIDENIYKENN